MEHNVQQEYDAQNTVGMFTRTAIFQNETDYDITLIKHGHANSIF